MEKNKIRICYRRFYVLLVTLFYAYSIVVYPLPVYSEELNNHEPVTLDLSATNPTINGSTIVQSNNANPLIINVGGESVTVTPESILTHAELIAAQQVLSSGTQSLVIGTNRNAIGGSFVLNPASAQTFSQLVVPQGVTALSDFGLGSSLNIAGNLINSGTLYAFSSNPQINTGTILATNIFNQPGAILSSVLPSTEFLGVTNAVSGLNLQLIASQNILNAGTIASSGNLSLIASNSIINAIPQNISTTVSSPIIQALASLNLQANSIVNSGILTSQSNNLNIVTTNLVNSGILQALSGNLAIQNNLGTNLNINNMLGSISAQNNILMSTLSGSSDYSGPLAELTLNGGTVTAAVTEMISPQGNININVEYIDGLVGISGANANITVDRGTLDIANLSLTGDPSFTNNTGDVNLGPGPAPLGTASFNIFGGGSVFATNGAIFSVSAGGNIVALNGAAGTIDASLAGGVGGAITLVAGTSPTGGSVILPNVNFRTNGNTIQITANASATNNGTVSVGTLNSSGAGAACCYNQASVKAPSGQSAGAITVAAPGGIVTGSIQAFGGGGAGGFATAASGGDGGNGNTVQLISTKGNITIDGEINTSGGGGGGLSASQVLSTSGGKGGNAGNIIITAGGAFASAGPLLAAGGGGGAGNTIPPCCPQGYRNGGGSFGGGGGGGDVGAGGGGYFGGGGSRSFGSGGGGGFFGGGIAAPGQQNGSLGRGGNTNEGSVHFVGGNFGAGGGGPGSTGGDGNLINNTVVAQKGFGNAGGAGGLNGNVNVAATAANILGTIGSYLGPLGSGFANSPFVNTSVFGTFTFTQVTPPTPPPPGTPTIAPVIIAGTVQNAITPEQVARLDLLSSSTFNTNSIRNFDTNPSSFISDWGTFLDSTGQIILVNSPESTNSLAWLFASQPTGVSSLGNSLSAAMESFTAIMNSFGLIMPDSDIPGPFNQNDQIARQAMKELFDRIQLQNALAAEQAAKDGKFSLVTYNSLTDSGFAQFNSYLDSTGFSGFMAYQNAGFGMFNPYQNNNGFNEFGAYNENTGYSPFNNSDGSSNFTQYDTGNSFQDWQIRNAWNSYVQKMRGQSEISFGGPVDLEQLTAAKKATEAAWKNFLSLSPVEKMMQILENYRGVQAQRAAQGLSNELAVVELQMQQLAQRGAPYLAQLRLIPGMIGILAKAAGAASAIQSGNEAANSKTMGQKASNLLDLGLILGTFVKATSGPSAILLLSKSILDYQGANLADALADKSLAQAGAKEAKFFAEQLTSSLANVSKGPLQCQKEGINYTSECSKALNFIQKIQARESNPQVKAGWQEVYNSIQSKMPSSPSTGGPPGTSSPTSTPKGPLGFLPVDSMDIVVENLKQNQVNSNSLSILGLPIVDDCIGLNTVAMQSSTISEGSILQASEIENNKLFNLPRLMLGQYPLLEKMFLSEKYKPKKLKLINEVGDRIFSPLVDFDMSVSSTLLESPFPWDAILENDKMSLATADGAKLQSNSYMSSKHNALVDFVVSPESALFTAQFPWVDAVQTLEDYALIASTNQYPASIDGLKIENENLFLCPQKQSVVKSDLGTIVLATGARVLVLKTDRSLSIYNLHDNHRDDVKLVARNRSLTVSPGHFIVICKGSISNFDNINAARSIAYRSLRMLSNDATQGTIFVGEFSIASALKSVSCLRNLAHAKSDSDRKIYRSIFKTALALSHLQSSGGQFKTSPLESSKRDLRSNSNLTAKLVPDLLSFTE